LFCFLFDADPSGRCVYYSPAMRAVFSFNGSGPQVTCLQATPEWDLPQPGRR